MKNCFINVYKQDDAKINIFLFPFAGGTAQSYRFLYQSHDIKGCNIYALEMPGRGVRMSEPFTMNINDIRETCLSDITSITNDKMIFCGHSMGAIIAYELLRDVELMYPQSKSSLLVSAVNPPQILKNKHDIFEMTPDEFKQYVIQMGGLPDKIMSNDSLLDFFIPRIYSDFGLLQQYKPRINSPLISPINLIAPIDDNNLDLDHLSDWQNYTNSGFSMQRSSGGHFYLYSSPEILRDELKRIIKDFTDE